MSYSFPDDIISLGVMWNVMARARFPSVHFEHETSYGIMYDKYSNKIYDENDDFKNLIRKMTKSNSYERSTID